MLWVYTPSTLQVMNTIQTLFMSEQTCLSIFMKQYHGVGISILNDKLGAFVHQRVAGQYAFRKDLWGGMLSAGVQVGMLFEKLDGSKLDPEESS